MSGVQNTWLLTALVLTTHFLLERSRASVALEFPLCKDFHQGTQFYHWLVLPQNIPESTPG
jgi:hypothetical protein